jgi:hypothetical protein
MTRPSKLPQFAINDINDLISGKPNVSEPSQSLKDTGWLRKQKPPRQYLNWLHRTTYNYLAWLESLIDSSITASSTIINQSLKTTDSPNFNGLSVEKKIINEGIKWTTRVSVVDNLWNSICYGNGLFVAVASSGNNNRIMTSPDGINWTSRISPADLSWSSICYGNGLFVAVASDGVINSVMTSPDGINWTLRTSAFANYWSSICYGNGLFVAVAYYGTNNVMTSTDGINWTLRIPSEDNGWMSVCYGNGLFLAVSYNGYPHQVMKSSDGINWVVSHSSAELAWNSVCYGNGLFVAVASNNGIMTSIDGNTWISRTPSADNGWMSVCYGNGLFVAVSYIGDYNQVMTSSDGIDWVTRITTANNYWSSICYGNGIFVAVAYSGSGDRVMTSGNIINNILQTDNIHHGGMSIYSGVNVNDGDITNINTLTFHNVSNYILKVEEDADTGIYYNITNHTWEWHQNGTQRAYLDLDNGNFQVDGFAQIDGLLDANAGADIEGNVDINGTLDSHGAVHLYSTLQIDANTKIGTNYISYDGATSKGLTFDSANRSFIYNTANIDGDIRLSLAFFDDTSYAAGVGGGIQFLGKKDSYGNYAGWAGIKGIKANAIDGNYSGQLHFQTRLHGSNPITRMEIDENGNIITSGINWTLRTSASDNNWYIVCYGNGLFVAVATSGNGNRVMTSPDGINWTSRSTPADNQWTSVCYGNGLFVAVANTGTNDRVMISSNGITWTSAVSPNLEWMSVCYGNGLFVAVAQNNTGSRVMTSTDGITWTLRNTPVDNMWQSVCYGNGLFVAVSHSGNNNRVMTSTNGIDWTIRTTPADNGWYSICYGNGLFVAVAYSGNNNRVMTSPNGIDWTIRTTPINISWVGIGYGNGLFVAVSNGGTGNGVMTSPNGIDWTIRTTPIDNQWISVCYANGIFVVIAGSGNGNRVMTSGNIVNNILQTNNVYQGGISIYGGINVNSGDITNINTLMFSNVSNYIMKVEADADTGIYYNITNHTWEWHQNGIQRAYLDLDNGNFQVDGFAQIDGLLDANAGADIEGNVDINGTLDNHGAVHFYSTLQVDADIIINTNATNIRPNTIDGSDSNAFNILGGGGWGNARGAGIMLAGNEYASRPGRLVLAGGSTGFIEIYDNSNIGLYANYIGYAGTANKGISIDSNNLVSITAASSTYGYEFQLIDDNAMAASVGGSMVFSGKYTTGGAVTYWAAIKGVKTNATSGEYGGQLRFQTRPNGGNLTDRITIYEDGGVVVGSPTGGSKGAGTVNAVAVYDDNVLLTGYVLDKFYNPNFDISMWDSKGKDGIHNGVREFINMADICYDIDRYSKFLKEEKCLPSFFAIEHNEVVGSVGEMISRLWQDLEIAHIHIDKLNNKNLNLEERIRVLETK